MYNCITSTPGSVSRLPGQVVAGSPVVVTCRGEGGHPTPELEASLVTHKGERSLQVQAQMCGARV